MKKIKLLKTTYNGGLKNSEEIIEVYENQVDELCNNTKSLDVFYTKLKEEKLTG